jgi:8-oxo-dGTP pyrophosphatase MutT (NUDIX family)
VSSRFSTLSSLVFVIQRMTRIIASGPKMVNLYPTMDDSIRQFKTRFQKAVEAKQRLVVNQPDLTPASVLVPIVFRGGAPHLIVTKRTMNVATHKGQISFPGGMREPEDRDAVATALRESEEEIGLVPDAVDVIGLLDDFVTVTGFLVTPVVGFVASDAICKADPIEVAEIIEVPFATLLDPAMHDFGPVERDGVTYSSHFYAVEGHTIWGATAGLIHQFLSALDEAA